jgi:antitoxin (DNA-binding transcriptional repressor) of toxin-antitoxin stability system
MRRKEVLPVTTTIDIRDLPARLEEALALASAGGEVILLEGSVPRAKIVPAAPVPQRVAGLHPGAIQAAPDFDAPLPEEFWTGQS